MIKGKRVYLDDLIEEYPGEPKKYYAVYHKDRILDGPFIVIAAGKRRISFYGLYGKRNDRFNGDCGLIPYSSHNWNENNATFEMLSELQWQDDWM